MANFRNSNEEPTGFSINFWILSFIDDCKRFSPCGFCLRPPRFANFDSATPTLVRDKFPRLYATKSTQLADFTFPCRKVRPPPSNWFCVKAVSYAFPISLCFVQPYIHVFGRLLDLDHEPKSQSHLSVVIPWRIWEPEQSILYWTATCAETERGSRMRLSRNLVSAVIDGYRKEYWFSDGDIAIFINHDFSRCRIGCSTFFHICI